MRADLVILGGLVWPVAAPPIEDGGVAVAGDRIAAVGRAGEVEELIGPGTRVVRLPEGRTVLPGFVDSHQHLQGYLETASQLQLREVRSLAELLDAVAAAARERGPGEWVVAAGHDESRLAERRHPTRAELDAAAPANPVLVRRSCSHVAIANARALALGGRDPRSDGVLVEAAQRDLKRLVPPPRLGAADFRRAAREYHRRGITSIGEASAGNRRVEDAGLLERAVREGDLPLRVTLMARGALCEALLAGEAPPLPADEWVRLGPLKLMADGVVGGGTAWLSEDYADAPGSRGAPLLDPAELRETVRRAHERGFQVAVHAIGDAAVEAVVEAVEAAQSASPRGDARHRIEHVEVARPELAERMAAAGIVASIQTLFTHWSSRDDADVTRLPGRLRGWAHPWGGLARAGVRLCDGSDNPVVPDFAPLLGIHAAVTRRTHDGGELGPEHALTLEQALHAATRGGAVATFEEDRKGALAPGRLADLCVLSGDVREVERLPELEVELTAVGGRIVHELLAVAA